MSKKVVRRIVFTTFADFCTGMATAWAFASYDALIHLAWMDLLSSLGLAILSLVLSISIKLNNDDKHS